jgi:hypothetical protein
MRLATAFAVGLLLVSAGCKPVPKDQQLPVFKKQVKLYFNNLNNDAQQRKENLRKERLASERNPALNPPTGTTYSTFSWDEEGYVVENFRCQVSGCGVKLLLPVPAAEYLCKSCGHCPYKMHPPGTNLKQSPCATCLGPDGIPKPPAEDLIQQQVKGQEGALVKAMFELTQEQVEKPLEAKVRYVRRLWVFDERGGVPVSQKILDRAKTGPIDTKWIPKEENAGGDWRDREARYGLPGFHRMDGEYVGEITFRLKGGEIVEIARTPEQPVRPWKDLKAAAR